MQVSCAQHVADQIVNVTLLEVTCHENPLHKCEWAVRGGLRLIRRQQQFDMQSAVFFIELNFVKDSKTATCVHVGGDSNGVRQIKASINLRIAQP